MVLTSKFNQLELLFCTVMLMWPIRLLCSGQLTLTLIIYHHFLVTVLRTRSDLNEYDFTESRWSVVPAAGRRPRARYRATCVVFRNTMISYGGHDGTRHLSDAHVFDFDTRTWSTLVTEGTPPIPRDSHVSVVHGNSMYCFGGSSGSAMNDLHELQLPSNPSAPAKWCDFFRFPFLPTCKL
jgi:Kelch motif